MSIEEPSRPETSEIELDRSIGDDAGPRGAGSRLRWLSFLKPHNPQEALALALLCSVLIGAGAGIVKLVDSLTASTPWSIRADEACFNVGNEFLAVRLASVYHQLGILSQRRFDLTGDRMDLDKARDFYLRALEINERLGNRVGAGRTYGQLGLLSWLSNDVVGAKEAFQHALDSGNTAAAFNLGSVLRQRGDHAGALEAFRRAIKSGDPQVTQAAKLEVGKLTGASDD